MNIDEFDLDEDQTSKVCRNDRFIYLAAPYSHPLVAVRTARFHRICQEAGRIMKAGFVVFSPISHSHPIAECHDLPNDWQFWSHQDAVFLRLSSKVVVLKLDGWEESVGVNAEVEWAKKLGIPVEYLEP